MAKLLAAEETALRVADAQERAARKARVEEYRREATRKELLKQQSRVPTFVGILIRFRRIRVRAALRLASRVPKPSSEISAED